MKLGWVGWGGGMSYEHILILKLLLVGFLALRGKFSTALKNFQLHQTLGESLRMKGLLLMKVGSTPSLNEQISRYSDWDALSGLHSQEKTLRSFCPIYGSYFVIIRRNLHFRELIIKNFENAQFGKVKFQ